jgi:hypothetical protein
MQGENISRLKQRRAWPSKCAAYLKWLGRAGLSVGKELIGDSVDEIAWRSRLAAKAPGRGARWLNKKNRQFLAKPAGA